MTGPGAPTSGAGHGSGPRQPGAVSAVLLLHGQPGRGADWDGVAPFLPEGTRVLAPDRPGYDRGPATTMLGNADALADMVRARDLVPAVVVGHSYGGGIALLLADRHPELVAGLVLVASVGGEDTVAAVDRLLAFPVVGPAMSGTALLASAWAGPRLRRRLRRFGARSAQMLGRYLPDDRVAASAADRGARRSFAVEQRALVAELPAVASAAAEVACPTVVVVGTRDLVVPPRAGARLAAAVPGAECWLVAGAGHFLLEDAPRTVARAVARVLERAERAR